MPLYTYVCDACGARTTEMRPIAQRDDPVPCPNPSCGRQPDGSVVQYAMTRTIDAPAVQFRGAGVTRGSQGFGKANAPKTEDSGGGAAETQATS